MELHKLRFVVLQISTLLAIGRASNDLHFVHRPDYLLILPRVVNPNRPMNVYAACDYDDCRIVLLFQCLRYAPDGAADKLADSEIGGATDAATSATDSLANGADRTANRLIDVYDLAVSRHTLLLNRSELISFDLPNLERCFGLDLGQRFNRLAVEAHVQFVNGLNMPGQSAAKHRFDLTVSGFVHVKIATSLPVYRGGQTVRFFILPFNLNFKPFGQAVQISLILPNKLVARRWSPSYFAHDQLNEFAYRLADRPPVGLYTIEVTVLNQKFRKCFFVIEQYRRHRNGEIELSVSFKPDYLLLDQNRFEGSIAIGAEDANLENYLIKCSIYLQFKDLVERQEGKMAPKTSLRTNARKAENNRFCFSKSSAHRIHHQAGDHRKHSGTASRLPAGDGGSFAISRISGK